MSDLKRLKIAAAALWAIADMDGLTMDDHPLKLCTGQDEPHSALTARKALRAMAEAQP